MTPLAQINHNTFYQKNKLRSSALTINHCKLSSKETIFFPLTKEEFEVMKTHCSLGSNILSGSNKELVQMAQGIAYNHHEKWDGSGYPSGKSRKTKQIAMYTPE